MLKGPFPFLDKKMTIFDLTWSTGPGVQSTLHLGPWWRGRRSNRPRVSPRQGPPQFHIDQNINHVFRPFLPTHLDTLRPSCLTSLILSLIDSLTKIKKIKAVMKLRTEEAEEAMQQLEEVLMMMIINIINIMILVFINIIIMITWSARGGATLAHDDDHHIDTSNDGHHHQNL